MTSTVLLSPVFNLSPGFLFYILLLFSGVFMGFLKYRSLAIWIRYLTQMLALIFAGAIGSKLILYYSDTNFPVFHFLQIAQLVYFGLIFSSLFSSSMGLKRFTFTSAITLSAISIAISVYFQSIWTFPSIGAILLSSFVSLNSVLLLFRMIQSPIEKPILQQSEFWFASGSLVFYAITFFILGFFKVILASNGAMPDWTYLILHWANHVLYFSYFIVIVLSSKNTSEHG